MQALGRHARDVTGLSFVAAGWFMGGVLLLGWDGGSIGALARDTLLLGFGQVSYLLPPVGFAVGVLIVARSRLADPGPFRVGLYVLVPTLLLAFGSGRFGLGSGTLNPEDFSHDLIMSQGGYVGAAMYYASHALTGEPGTTIMCVLGLSIGILFVTGSSLQAILSAGASRLGDAASRAGATSRTVVLRAGELATEGLNAATGTLANTSTSQGIPDMFGDVPREYAIPDGDDQALLGAVVEPDYELETVEPDTASAQPDVDASLAEWLAGDDDDADAEPGDQLALLAAGEDAEEDVATQELDARVAAARKPYRLPSPQLLERSSGEVGADARESERIRGLLVETLQHFGIESKVVAVVPGPRVSRYELQLAPGTRMSKVENLRKDLSYALATTEIRILAPIPGKSAVGIEVENQRPSTVTLGDIYSERPRKSSPLHVFFGKDISGQVVGADLARMPHLLVAGTTGSGKSGCMNAILSSIVLGATPDEVRMLLIDPKKVELSSYEGIPHLLTPVVTNMKKAANALSNVIERMESRYAAMELAGARTLTEFNRALVKRGDEPVPHILVVIDELADLIMVSRSEVEDAVIRVAQKGRAAGFHLVLATQRPSVDVITGMIKSNIPSRIAFAVSSQTDSRVILDQGGAETLLGSGDMLIKPVWARAAQRVQGAWITEQEVRAICDAARTQREPNYEQELLDEPDTADDGAPGVLEEDDRLAEAVRLVAEYQVCSASMFQRRMRVGYTRGARLVDMLERRGWVGPSEGPKGREVYIGPGDVERILNELGAGTPTAGNLDAH